MRKYTKAEKAEVVSPEAHKAVENQLHSIGKTSAQNLTDKERQALTDTIQSTDDSQ